MDKGRSIAVVGLGYVGLPVALAFARKYPGTVGFDIDEGRVNALERGEDANGESSSEELQASSIVFSCDPAALSAADFYVVAVPTPIDEKNRPDLRSLRAATEMIAPFLAKGDIVVYESTVYPGLTEEFCGPLLEEGAGLKCGRDFKLGYSPERINPGDREHTLARIIKVVAGQDAETTDILAAVYGAIVAAGIHRAPSIQVAEAAKVIENTQRDLNIALMNEFALIFDRIGIRTHDVLAAAQTKWNFLPFRPGLVGGHCIGVDPFYLTTKAEELGYHPQVILSGRRINDDMGAFIADKAVEMLAATRPAISGARVAVLGLTFKENVRDLRNSKVPDIVAKLQSHGIDALIHDPLAQAADAQDLYGLALSEWSDLVQLDALILAVPHSEYVQRPIAELLAGLREGGAVIDIRSVLDPDVVPAGYVYWSL